jgi:hypothetical protein
MTHARNPRLLRVSVEKIGKWRLDQDGKYRVNENDEENLLQESKIAFRIITGRSDRTPPYSFSDAFIASSAFLSAGRSSFTAFQIIWLSTR